MHVCVCVFTCVSIIGYSGHSLTLVTKTYDFWQAGHAARYLAKIHADSSILPEPYLNSNIHVVDNYGLHACTPSNLVMCPLIILAHLCQIVEGSNLSDSQSTSGAARTDDHVPGVFS